MAAAGKIAAPALNEQLNRMKAGLSEESGKPVEGLLLAAAQTRMYDIQGNRWVKRKALPGGQQLKDASDREVSLSAPGFLVTGWTRMHALPAVAACIAATRDDEQLLGQELAKCSEVQRFFGQYLDRIRKVAEKRPKRFATTGKGTLRRSTVFSPLLSMQFWQRLGIG